MKQRNFTLLLMGQITSLLGNFTLKFALSMYVLDLTGSASIFAGLLTVAMLPTILLSPLGGILADRANRRNIMVPLDLLSGGAVLLCCLALPYGDHIALIGALLVTLSVLGAFESPTVQACVPQMLSGDSLLKGNAAVSQVAAIASLVTPFLGGTLYTAFGIMPNLWGAAVCFFVTAAFECFIRLDYQRPDTAMGIGAIVKEDFSVSMRFMIREQPAILKLLLLAALVSMFVAGTAVVGLPFLVRTVLGLSPNHYAAAESAMGVAAILGSVCVGLLSKKLRLRHLSIFFVALGACLLPAGIAFLMPIGVLAQYAILMAMFCLCQFACSVFSTYAICAIQQRTPQQLMGKVMAYVFTLSLCAQPLGQLAYGALFDFFSRSAYWVLIPTGLLVCVIGRLSKPFFADMDRQSSERASAACPPALAPMD